MKGVSLFDLTEQYQGLAEEIMPQIEELCRSQAFILGEPVNKFERNCEKYLGVASAIGVSSGTDALVLALMGLDCGEGQEVITSPFTFFATAGSIARVGAKPVFIDVEEDSFNLNPDLLQSALTKKTAGIMPVHLYGQCYKTSEVQSFADHNSLWIIDDAAQAIGAKRDGTKVGNFGDITAFSFFPTKNLGAFGDAGLVTTNNPELSEKLKCLRVHGSFQRYVHKIIGGNFRIDTIQALVLYAKLKYLDDWNQKRIFNAHLYRKYLKSLEDRELLKLPVESCGNFHTYHQYTIKTNYRDQLKEYLTEKNVGWAVYYPIPLHLQECFAYLGYKEGDLPVTEKLTKQVLSLPIYPELGEARIELVASIICDFFKRI